MQQYNDSNEGVNLVSLSSVFTLIMSLILIHFPFAYSSPIPSPPQSLQSKLLLQNRIVGAEIPNHAVLLLYHHVSDKTPVSTSISPHMFEQQLQFIADNNFQVWPLPKIISSLNQGITIPDKVIAITFDDGYRSIYTEAFPRLRQRKWPFTVFVNTQAIDHNFGNQMRWEELRLMAKNGATIANHSTYHRHLLRKKKGETQPQWKDRVIQDIQNAKYRITQEIGTQSQLFAYPYGEYNSELKEIIKQLGLVGLSQLSGAIGKNSDFLALARYPIAGHYTKLENFVIKLLSLPMPIKQSVALNNPLDNKHTHPALTLYFDKTHKTKHLLQCFGNKKERLNIQWHEDNPHAVTITPNQAIPVGRSRYNCTLQHSDQRFYWYSHGWIRKPINTSSNSHQKSINQKK